MTPQTCTPSRLRRKWERFSQKVQSVRFALRLQVMARTYSHRWEHRRCPLWDLKALVASTRTTSRSPETTKMACISTTRMQSWTLKIAINSTLVPIKQIDRRIQCLTGSELGSLVEGFHWWSLSLRWHSAKTPKDQRTQNRSRDRMF